MAADPADHPGLAVRIAVAARLDDVLNQGRPLDAFAAGPQGDRRDAALGRSITAVALRRLGTIRKALDGLLARPLPRRAGLAYWHLVVGAAQILFLDVPDHAAVDLAVEAVRSSPRSQGFAGLANAVLRALARRRETILADSDPLRDDTPAWLAARWTETYGPEAARAIATAHREEPTLDVSVKADPAAWAERLGGIVLPNGSVRLLTHAPIETLPGFADGEWWVQDAAAALAAGLVQARPGERIADLCAAPGGKTALLAQAGAAVTCVDHSARRTERLKANLRRLKLAAETVVADAQTFEGGPFDAVLLDAPCSATGTIRRHPDVAWTKAEAQVAALAALQTRLLDNAAGLLRPGGRLVYCVCSLEREEGEDQIATFLRARAAFARDRLRPEDVGGLAECLTSDGDLRTLPFHLPDAEPRLAGLDGFFAARLLRHG